MRKAYKVILTPEANGFTAYIPDFDCGTQGKDLADVIYMVRDAIGMMGITLQDTGKKIPNPGEAECAAEEWQIVTYVDVDFAEYRKRYENRKIKKTLTISSWLNDLAERENINFSRLLEEALMEKMGVESK